MKSAEVREIILKPVKAGETPVGFTALDVDYGALEDHFTRAALAYDADRTAYFDSYGEDPKLPEKTKKWQRSAKRLAGWAEAWFAVHAGDNEEQQSALDILDRITKDAGIRNRNIWKHRDLMKEKLADDQKKLEDLENAEYAADAFFRSAIKTQQHFNDLFEKGASFMPVIMKEEIEAGEQLSKVVHKFPPDRIFTRAWIFPIERIPLNEPCPQVPDAYTRVKFIEPDSLIYDPKADELVPVPGYVSGDGLIDDKSVVWHPETMTVDIGYRGGEHVTWGYWKPKDDEDVIDPNSWCAEYQYRAFQEWLASRQPGILIPKGYELDLPYNRKPLRSG